MWNSYNRNGSLKPGWVGGQDKHGCVKKHSAEIFTSLGTEPKEGKGILMVKLIDRIMIKSGHISFLGGHNM